MTSKTRRLAFSAGFVVLFALTIWSWIPSGAVPEADAPALGVEPTPTQLLAGPTQPSLDPSHDQPASTGTIERQSYAIGLHDIAGLSHETPPGTLVELWVAWDPPITDKPQYQRLIPAAIIEEIQPPFVPEGPFTVMLSVPAKKIGDLLYADRYGAISATLPQ